MAMVTWLLFSCGWSRIGQWRMTVFCFFTSGWEEAASVWWLPSGQCWASVTASPRCDRDVRSSLRSLSSGHLWRDVLVIGGDHCFEAWSSLGSQRTLGEQTMLWRWPPPPVAFVTANGASETLHHKISVANIWPWHVTMQQTTDSETVAVFCRSCAEDCGASRRLF